MAIKTHTFTSSSSKLRLVRQPGFPAHNAFGKQQGWLQKSVVYEFEEIGHGYGKLTLTDGQDKIKDGPLNDDGEPTEQDALQWIRTIPEYNNVGIPGGFVEDGREPGRVPDSTDVLDDIAEAGVHLDPETLRAIIQGEEDSWKREQVLTLARRTLDRVESVVTRQDDAAAAQKALEADAEKLGKETSAVQDRADEDRKGQEKAAAEDEARDEPGKGATAENAKKTPPAKPKAKE